MTGSIRTAQIPLPQKYSDLRPVFDLLLRYIDQLDLRNAGSPMAGGALFDGETLRLRDAAKIETQRVLPTVATGSRISVQSAQPLSALSGSTQIDVAAHTVTYGFGTVAYNSGSITGLTADTLYYVYADDDDLQGGAVSYFATTTPQDLASANSRYFVGSIKTPAAADAVVITAINNGYPAYIDTASPMGWSDFNTITIAGALGMTQIDGGPYQLTRINASRYKLDYVNTSAFGVYTASSATATRNATSQVGSGGATAGGGGSVVYLGGGY